MFKARYSLLIILLLIGTVFNTTRAQTDSIDDILSEMTLEQKVGQMFMVSFATTQLLEVERDFLQTWQPGAIVIFSKNIDTPQQITGLTNTYQQAMVDVGAVPLFIAADQEGGSIQHLNEGFTRLPTPMLLTATQDEDLAYRYGAAVAEELLAVGVNMNLAPVADLNTNPDNPIIGRRSFGTEIEMVSPILMSFIRGVQDNGVMATAKHFPGHGDTDSDSHVQLPLVRNSIERLEAVELMPFHASISADVGTVMVAHIWFPALEEAEMPASLSRNIVTGLLRDEMAYAGIIMTDALDMDAIDTVYTPGGSAIQAILAGNDLIAIGAHVGTQTIATAMQDVVDAVQDGRISIEQIDASLRRILSAKAHYGILEWQALEPDRVEERLNLEAHDALIDELFRKGITVARDKNSAIPLSGNVAIIYPATRPRIATECAGVNGTVHFSGVSDNPSDEEISWAMAAASKVDSVVVFTQNARTNPNQQKLVNALPVNKTIVVALWEVDDIRAFPDIAGYVVGYSPMLRASAIICDVLTGRIPAKGKFPLSFVDVSPLG